MATVRIDPSSYHRSRASWVKPAESLPPAQYNHLVEEREARAACASVHRHRSIRRMREIADPRVSAVWAHLIDRQLCVIQRLRNMEGREEMPRRDSGTTMYQAARIRYESAILRQQQMFEKWFHANDSVASDIYLRLEHVCRRIVNRAFARMTVEAGRPK